MILRELAVAKKGGPLMWGLLIVLFSQDPSAVAAVKSTAYARVTIAQKIAGAPTVIAFVAEKNASGETRAAIDRHDAAWTTQADYPLQRTLTTNACARYLSERVAPDPLIVEAFLMDRQGALVCASRVTSDYWQGDEAKWLKVFREDRDLFVGEPAHDASSDTFAIQLSVPVREGARKIGALTLTMRLAAP